MNSTEALREIAERYTEDYDRGIGYCPNPERASELLSDLNALISDHYVAKEYVDKMVEERLREELINFLKWDGITDKIAREFVVGKYLNNVKK